MTALTTHGEQLPEAGGVPADPDPAGSASVVEHVVGSARACAGGSPSFDEAATRGLAERDVARARDHASTLVNHYACEVDRPTRDGFGDIAAPTPVVHGDHDPLPPHGEALRDAIPGAEPLVLEGVGPDLAGPVRDAFVPVLVRHTGRGR